MKTVNIKGKNYVPVNERLKYFREHYPKYSLRTELVSVNEDVALVKAVIRDEQDRIVAEGTAHERADNNHSMVNSTSYVENAETSAWGRALGNLGIGIDASVATADEVANAIKQEQVKTKLEGRSKLPPSATKVMEHLTEAKTLNNLIMLYKRAMTGYVWTKEDREKIDECYKSCIAKFQGPSVP